MKARAKRTEQVAGKGASSPVEAKAGRVRGGRGRGLAVATACLAGVATVLLFACQGGGRGEPVTVASLLEHVADPMWLPRLDQPDTRLYTSYDPAGGDDDYNHFLRPSQEPGWQVMVDLKGPGYVSRIFTTGAMPGDPFLWRFYFDGEKTPRLEGDIQELFGGGVAPFLRPLTEYKNNCWYSFLPQPFAKSLRIECKPDWRDAKAFFQVSVSTLPRGTKVETFTPELGAEGRAALDRALACWEARDLPEPDEARAVETVLDRDHANWKLDVPAEAAYAGGAVLRRLEVRPDWDALSAAQRDAILRDWMLEIRWDGADEASVRVPLGDFFGMPWRREAAQGHFFGMTPEGALFNALPGPFRREIALRLVPGEIPLVPTQVRAMVAPLADGGAGGTDVATPPMGYLHAGFRKTTTAAGGSPHVVANYAGRRGKYVGCLLAVATLDGSYWVLEGDESIRKDDEKIAAWHGTGLEDYFNAGWYYRNVMTSPQHGLFLKEAHRTVQYRLHGADPSLFDDRFQMSFERLPRQGNRNTFESTAFAYFAEPGAADTQSMPPRARARPIDPQFDVATVMFALWNYERFNDLRGEYEHLAARLASDLPKAYDAASLRMFQLRLAMLGERLRAEGQTGAGEGAEDVLAPFLAEGQPEGVRQAAEVFRRERDEAGAYTAYLYANLPVQIFLDGKPLHRGTGHPAAGELFTVQLTPGEHEVQLLTPDQPYPDWVFLAFRKGNWLWGTDEDWLFTLNAPQGFPTDGGPRTEAAGWYRVAKGVHGPPTEPYYFVAPDAAVGLFLGGEGCGGPHGLRGIRAQRDYPGGHAPPGVRKGFVKRFSVAE